MGEAEIRFRHPLSNMDHTEGKEGMETTLAVHQLCTIYQEPQSHLVISSAPSAPSSSSFIFAKSCLVAPDGLELSIAQAGLELTGF